MEVWEQHEGEPEEEYVRFLYFRNLGPTRSLDTAYQLYVETGEIETKEKAIVRSQKVPKRHQAPGNWREEYRTYQWQFRSNQWDIHTLEANGKAVISDFYQILSEMTFQTLQTIRKGHLVPKNYAEFLEGLTILGSLVSPEAVAGWINNPGSNSTENPATATGANISSIESKRGKSKPA